MSAPCPFADDPWFEGLCGPCCTLRGDAVARELEAWNELPLSRRMYEDMTDEEAVVFASELRAAADRVEWAHEGKYPKPQGAGRKGHLDAKKREWVFGSYSTFEQSLSVIRRAALWYETVGKLGFSVDAWY